jgi:AraC family transcriptional regulator
VERVEVHRQGARAVKTAVGAFSLQRLRFPAGHAIPWFEPEWGYLALVLEGSMQKRFSRDSWSLARDSFASLPCGAGHSTQFGANATHVLTVYPCSEEAGALFTRFLRERREIIAPAAVTLGRRIACEMEAPDASSALAVEGLVLQLLALGERESTASAWRGTVWVSAVAELLRDRTPHAPSLSELAAEAGVHPGHLSRAFRQAFGVTVCEYSRSLRLDWATAQLESDAPLAQVALEAGFADQSHFTRAFRCHVGVTPGRYRELLRR